MSVFVATGFAPTGNEMVDIEVLQSANLGAHNATSYTIELPGNFGLIIGGTGFGGYTGNHPTTGTITSWYSYNLDEGNEPSALFTGFSISVANFNNWIATGNDAALQNAMFGGNDTIIGSSYGDEGFYGYGGNDVLRGGGGGDNLYGGAGLDTADYSTSGVAVNVNLQTGAASDGDAQGDTLNSIENLAGSLLNDVLTGNGAANVLNGAAGADTLLGGSGADTLKGGTGHDTLTGGTGADKFVFNTLPQAAHSDTITDFTHASDKIQIDNSGFSALGANGVLAPAKFWIGANAHDANDRVIYNSATGALFYDDDGNGAHAKILIATLDSGLALTASDFQVI